MLATNYRSHLRNMVLFDIDGLRKEIQDKESFVDWLNERIDARVFDMDQTLRKSFIENRDITVQYINKLKNTLTINEQQAKNLI